MKTEGPRVGKTMLEQTRQKYKTLRWLVEEQGSLDIHFEHFVEILKNKRRREVLKFISSDGSRNEYILKEITEEVTSRIYEKEKDEITDKEYKRIYVSLYQNHLELLDDFGALEWNEDGKVIRGTKETELLASIIEKLEGIFQ